MPSPIRRPTSGSIDVPPNELHLVLPLDMLHATLLPLPVGAPVVRAALVPVAPVEGAPASSHPVPTSSSTVSSRPSRPSLTSGSTCSTGVGAGAPHTVPSTSSTDDDAPPPPPPSAAAAAPAVEGALLLLPLGFPIGATPGLPTHSHPIQPLRADEWVAYCTRTLAASREWAALQLAALPAADEEGAPASPCVVGCELCPQVCRLATAVVTGLGKPAPPPAGDCSAVVDAVNAALGTSLVRCTAADAVRPTAGAVRGLPPRCLTTAHNLWQLQRVLRDVHSLRALETAGGEAASAPAAATTTRDAAALQSGALPCHLNLAALADAAVVLDGNSVWLLLALATSNRGVVVPCQESVYGAASVEHVVDALFTRYATSSARAAKAGAREPPLVDVAAWHSVADALLRRSGAGVAPAAATSAWAAAAKKSRDGLRAGLDSVSFAQALLSLTAAVDADLAWLSEALSRLASHAGATLRHVAAILPTGLPTATPRTLLPPSPLVPQHAAPAPVLPPLPPMATSLDATALFRQLVSGGVGGAAAAAGGGDPPPCCVVGGLMVTGRQPVSALAAAAAAATAAADAVASGTSRDMTPRLTLAPYTAAAAALAAATEASPDAGQAGGARGSCMAAMALMVAAMPQLVSSVPATPARLPMKRALSMSALPPSFAALSMGGGGGGGSGGGAAGVSAGHMHTGSLSARRSMAADTHSSAHSSGAVAPTLPPLVPLVPLPTALAGHPVNSSVASARSTPGIGTTTPRIGAQSAAPSPAVFRARQDSLDLALGGSVNGGGSNGGGGGSTGSGGGSPPIFAAAAAGTTTAAAAATGIAGSSTPPSSGTGGSADSGGRRSSSGVTMEVRPTAEVASAVMAMRAAPPRKSSLSHSFSAPADSPSGSTGTSCVTTPAATAAAAATTAGTGGSSGSATPVRGGSSQQVKYQDCHAATPLAPAAGGGTMVESWSTASLTVGFGTDTAAAAAAAPPHRGEAGDTAAAREGRTSPGASTVGVPMRPSPASAFVTAQHRDVPAGGSSTFASPRGEDESGAADGGAAPAGEVGLTLPVTPSRPPDISRPSSVGASSGGGGGGGGGGGSGGGSEAATPLKLSPAITRARSYSASATTEPGTLPEAQIVALRGARAQAAVLNSPPARGSSTARSKDASPALTSPPPRPPSRPGSWSRGISPAGGGNGGSALSDSPSLGVGVDGGGTAAAGSSASTPIVPALALRAIGIAASSPLRQEATGGFGRRMLTPPHGSATSPALGAAALPTVTLTATAAAAGARARSHADSWGSATAEMTAVLMAAPAVGSEVDSARTSATDAPASPQRATDITTPAPPAADDDSEPASGSGTGGGGASRGRGHGRRTVSASLPSSDATAAAADGGAEGFPIGGSGGGGTAGTGGTGGGGRSGPAGLTVALGSSATSSSLSPSPLSAVKGGAAYSALADSPAAAWRERVRRGGVGRDASTTPPPAARARSWSALPTSTEPALAASSATGRAASAGTPGRPARAVSATDAARPASATGAPGAVEELLAEPPRSAARSNFTDGSGPNRLVRTSVRNRSMSELSATAGGSEGAAAAGVGSPPRGGLPATRSRSGSLQAASYDIVIPDSDVLLAGPQDHATLAAAAALALRSSSASGSQSARLPPTAPLFGTRTWSGSARSPVSPVNRLGGGTSAGGSPFGIEGDYCGGGGGGSGGSGRPRSGSSTPLGGERLVDPHARVRALSVGESAEPLASPFAARTSPALPRRGGGVRTPASLPRVRRLTDDSTSGESTVVLPAPTVVAPPTATLVRRAPATVPTPPPLPPPATVVVASRSPSGGGGGGGRGGGGGGGGGRQPLWGARVSGGSHSSGDAEGVAPPLDEMKLLMEAAATAAAAAAAATVAPATAAAPPPPSRQVPPPPPPPAPAPAPAPLPLPPASLVPLPTAGGGVAPLCTLVEGSESARSSPSGSSSPTGSGRPPTCGSPFGGSAGGGGGDVTEGGGRAAGEPRLGWGTLQPWLVGLGAGRYLPALFARYLELQGAGLRSPRLPAVAGGLTASQFVTFLDAVTDLVHRPVLARSASAPVVPAIMA